MLCPECKAPRIREEVDNGVGLVVSPWICTRCFWCEDDGFPMTQQDWDNKFNEEDVAL